MSIYNTEFVHKLKLKLSPREFEVAELIERGYGVVDISKFLKIKKGTVEQYINRITKKGVDMECEILEEERINKTKNSENQENPDQPKPEN